MGQELWLTEQQLPSMNSLGAQFVARSGMESAISSGILRGRPFGGVSIAWSANLNHVVKPLSNFRHKRVVGVEMDLRDRNILLISVYMPCFDTRKREECLLESIDAISMLEEMLCSHPQHDIVIGGDLNTELKGNSPFDPLWREFMSKHDLLCCDNLMSSPITYTYSHDSLGQRKWNDHFIVSKSLSNNIKDHRILDEGGNVSDHLPVLLTLPLTLSAEIAPQIEESVKSPKLRWDKLTKDQRDLYEERLSHILENTSSPYQCQRRCHCDDAKCQDAIQGEYDSLIRCLKRAAAPLPRHKPGVEKSWWTPVLTELHNQSIDVHRRWIAVGKPLQGFLHLERLRIRALYKKALRDAQRAPKQEAWNRLHTAMSTNDTDTFWKSWRTLYAKNKSHLPPVVDGNSSKTAIAESFRSTFTKNARPNNPQKVKEIDEKFGAAYDALCASHAENCNCESYNITLDNVFDAVLCLKIGKSADDEEISAEHFLNAPYNFFVRLQAVFNLMLVHSFVPKQFKFGTIIPLVKDHHGNRSDVNNYRGITISPIASKIFEHVLKCIFGSFLKTSPWQFGFKKKSSTLHALYCLKETINHYIENGSSVFCAFLDASKAFDRLVHSGLFLKLLNRNVPKIFLDIIIYWYSDLLCRVRWDDCFSQSFQVLAGVRQGGILSPDFYNLYVEDLIAILKSLNVGCYVLDIFLSALLYADDMAILAPSVKGLLLLLEACSEYCSEWDICLNAKKSKLMYFGKNSSHLYVPNLNGSPLEWVDSWDYLGVSVVSSRQFRCSATERIKKFYRCVNGILRIEGHSDDETMLSLVESHCIPILTYGIEICHFFDPNQKSKIRAAYNSVFRKIFGYRYFESVTDLQLSLARPTWEMLIEQRKIAFFERLSQCTADSPVHIFAIV